MVKLLTVWLILSFYLSISLYINNEVFQCFLIKMWIVSKTLLKM